jgi:nitric oxide reductase subunit B
MLLRGTMTGNMKEKNIALGFWLIALSCLIMGLLFGIAGSLQYVVPGFLKEQFSFAKMRPLHVFLITQWIICAATGSIYYFIPSIAKRRIAFPVLGKLHLLIQLFVIMVAVCDFFLGNFTGREYLEFPVWIIALMIIGWICAGINLIATVKPKYNTAPVYIWSWSTGILFFIITLTEASLWQFDHFNANIIRDITVQWKALGSMVGAWNMLIYGSAVYIMCRIKGNDDMARSKPAFFFYFLGMANLMFNWGHHTYIVPASPIIKNTAYIISMTELLILFNMIWKWGKSLRKENKTQHFSYRLLKMTDNWIILNLALAIAISIPALNAFTHGTHITVAHAMGATIGINTTILLAAGFYIYYKEKKLVTLQLTKRIKRTLLVFNISLFFFWVSLIGSGIMKAEGIADHKLFYDIMQQLQPWFRVFSISGFVLTGSIIVLAAPLVRQFFNSLIHPKTAVIIPMQETATVVLITKGEREDAE